MQKPKVIYQDDTILILNKPSGWVVNDAKTAHGNPIVQNWLKKNFSYELSKSFEERSGLVHRLDKETSGILIVGKNLSSFINLQEQFKNREVRKSYLALVHGLVKEKSGKISASISRLPWNRERFGVVATGRESLTAYELMSVYKDKSGKNYSMLKLKPKTGRTHQIRVHLKYIGHAVVSDTLYGGRKTARNDRLWCKRLFLHSEEISFKHPKSGKTIHFMCNLPDDLSLSLKNLQKV